MLIYFKSYRSVYVTRHMWQSSGAKFRSLWHKLFLMFSTPVENSFYTTTNDKLLFAVTYNCTIATVPPCLQKYWQHQQNLPVNPYSSLSWSSYIFVQPRIFIVTTKVRWWIGNYTHTAQYDCTHMYPHYNIDSWELCVTFKFNLVYKNIQARLSVQIYGDMITL